MRNKMGLLLWGCLNLAAIVLLLTASLIKIQFLSVSLFGLVCVLVLNIQLFFHPCKCQVGLSVLFRRVVFCFLSLRSSRPFPSCYIPLVVNKDYSIYKKKDNAYKVAAVWEEKAVLLNRRGTRIKICEDLSRPWLTFTVRWNKKNFPGLIKNAKIAECYVIPYMRREDVNRQIKSWRAIIITDGGQIFHNFPSRSTSYDGISHNADIANFEESVVWDLPGRKFPSGQKKCESWEIYYPGLPSEVYVHHPYPNDNANFRDIYGNGGFGKSTIVNQNGKIVEISRFYFYRREKQANPFMTMGGYEPDYKMTLLASYRSNTDIAARNVIFMTDDGGRQWYAKYEFGDMGTYSFRQGVNKGWGKNFGNKIKTDISLINFPQKRISIVKRIIELPFSKKEDGQFFWSTIASISRIWCEDTITLQTHEPHQMETGNIVAIISSPESNGDEKINWMLNNDISTHSCGNGLLFKVEVVDDYILRLYEFVANPANPLCCRHIHHVNRVKDGWIVGTGEVYPNGWLMYIQMKEADTYSEKRAYDEFEIVRLNTGKDSVQRTMGAIIRDDKVGTLIFASDHDLLSRDENLFMGLYGKKVCRSSTGIFSGTLKDIDLLSDFCILYEAKEPAFFFKELDGYLLYGGQRGELALSLNGGKSWRTTHIDGPLIHYKGRGRNFFVIDDYILYVH
ncbi:hypothetical protein [[Clostridium] symbiosum]|uniref:hypothetical protein n=1 Tax=Clostridium symbiosum TaxID=1512 RepID=UPI0018A033C9|nr:hypothetical protein [[Clostridium] symbiosum]